MPGILDMLKSRVHHATTGGGILSSLTGGGTGGGILSTAMGPFQARLASIQAAGSPQDKIKAFTSTLGARIRTPGGLLSGIGGTSSGSGGSTGSATGVSADAAYQVSGAGRVYGSPNPPPGIQYR